MKKMSVVKVLALFLGLNCLGPAWVNAAPPNADSHPNQSQQKLPSILGTWEGEGFLLQTQPLISSDVRNIDINVKLTISAQPAEMTFPQLGAGPLFHGRMEISFKDPDYHNTGGIPGFPVDIHSYTCEVAGYISASGDITLTGTTHYWDTMEWSPGIGPPVPEDYRSRTLFLKKEGTASLVSGKPRSIRGNLRVAVQGTDFWFGEPIEAVGTKRAEPYLRSTAFAGTFNVHEALAQ